MCNQNVHNGQCWSLPLNLSLLPLQHALILFVPLSLCAAFWVNSSVLLSNSLILPISMKFCISKTTVFFYFPGFLIHPFSFQISFLLLLFYNFLFSVNFFLKIGWLIDWLIAMLGLHFCARAFSSCGKRGPLFITVHGPLTIVASLVAEHRLQMRRLSSCGSQA